MTEEEWAFRRRVDAVWGNLAASRDHDRLTWEEVATTLRLLDIEKAARALVDYNREHGDALGSWECEQKLIAALKAYEVAP